MASFTPWRRMLYHLCHVHETSPGTHTLFPTYTCPVYCWRSVQLLDFGLSCNLIHASQPVRTTFTGQWFASGFLQTPPHGDALAIGCTLPTAGRVRDFHPLERAPAGHTRRRTGSVLPALRPACHHGFKGAVGEPGHLAGFSLSASPPPSASAASDSSVSQVSSSGSSSSSSP